MITPKKKKTARTNTPRLTLNSIRKKAGRQSVTINIFYYTIQNPKHKRECYYKQKTKNLFNMELSIFNFWGKTRYWWCVMILGILMIPAGLWLLFMPVQGYMAIAMLLGWGLLLYGVIQLTISGDVERRGHGWGWWLAGGIFDIFIGFLLISNLVLSELTLPYFFAFALLFRAISNIISSISMPKEYKYKWIYMINGILLLLVSMLFFYAPYMSTYVIVFICAFTFVYWGIYLILFSRDLKPRKEEPAGTTA